MVRLVSAMLVASTILRVPVSSRSECRILLRTFQLAVEGHDPDPAIEIGLLQGALHAADFSGAGQETKNVPVMSAQRRPHHL